MKRYDLISLIFIIICFLGIALGVHTKYTQLTYKYNNEMKNYISLSKEMKKLQIKVKSLSSPNRIIKFSSENLGLHLPNLNEVYSIDEQ